MTVAMLMENTFQSAKRWFDLSRKRDISPLPLELETPVPSDIEIAMTQTPKHLATLCKEIGLTESEVSTVEKRGDFKCG
jgi:methylenetetrahydrofolate dehydrogenase (NADP+)/methenyltetrahydrofolate cyclohydrolase/formyltetrahydrofolate synthetase